MDSTHQQNENIDALAHVANDTVSTIADNTMESVTTAESEDSEKTTQEPRTIIHVNSKIFAVDPNNERNILFKASHLIKPTFRADFGWPGEDISTKARMTTPQRSIITGDDTLIDEIDTENLNINVPRTPGSEKNVGE